MNRALEILRVTVPAAYYPENYGHIIRSTLWSTERMRKIQRLLLCVNDFWRPMFRWIEEGELHSKTGLTFLTAGPSRWRIRFIILVRSAKTTDTDRAVVCVPSLPCSLFSLTLLRELILIRKGRNRIG